MNTLSIEKFKNKILDNTPFIDVRAPIEFKAGAIPGSINLPVLDDEERHAVGTCYKEKGQNAAIQLGHQFVSGENLERKLSLWKTQLAKNPETIITCFRGGLRSQKTQKFLEDAGVETTRLEHGYKSARQFFIDQLQVFAATTPMVILSGTTGSGKTHVLNQTAEFYPGIDLEGLAHHRGSAFGAWSIPQPAQVDFENRLSMQTMKVYPTDKMPLLLEDESRLIGSCHIPEYFFLKMRAAPVILIEEPLQARVENIYADYISSLILPTTSNEAAGALFQKYKNSIQKIQKKLGGLRAEEITQDMLNCEADFIESKGLLKNKIWIEKLLVWYYDSMYLGSLAQRNPFISFKGTGHEVREYLKSKSSV